MAKQLQTNTKLVKGMYTDVHPLNQPPGSYRYALNIVFESGEGDAYSFSVEEGNKICFSLSGGYRIIGSIYLGNNDTIIFSVNPSTSKSEIGLVSGNCGYTALIKSSCLGFSQLYPVKGIYRIKNGCDRVIYFTDNFNEFRSINLDNLLQYTNLDMSNQHYSTAYANTNDEWNCDLFKHNPNYGVPEVSLNTIVTSGGTLSRGTYFFTIRYLDTEFNPTNWSYLSQGIPIQGGLLVDYDSVDGGNADLTGNFLFKENKSILLDISSLDVNFPFYQLGVIEVTNGVQNEGVAYELEVREVNTTTDSYIFTGASQFKTPTTIESLVTNTVVFNKVKTVEQIDNRLVIGNTQEDNKDWAIFQRQSSQILVNASNDNLDKTDINESTKSGIYYFDKRSYMKDEVYALGIVYVFKDGTESPVFHIPGRAKDSGATTSSTYTNQQLVTQGNSNSHNRNIVPSTLDGEPTTEGWDSQLLTVATPVVDAKREIHPDDVAHIPITEFTTPSGPKLGNTIERWKVVNTGIQFGSTSSLHLNSYFECNELYPSIQDCSGTSIWGTDYWGNDLEGTPIRHHKLFDSTLVAPQTGAEGRPSDKTDAGKQSASGQIATTFFVVSNVNYPTDYASEIQGYHIVRVERTSETETVVDKGIVGEIGQMLGSGSYYTAGDCGSIGGGGLDFFESPIFPGPFAGIADARIFISPKTQFEKSIKQVDYFKFERIYRGYEDPALEYYLEESMVTPSPPGRSFFLNRQSNGFFYIEPETYQLPTGAFTSVIENATKNMDFYVWALNATWLSGSSLDPEHTYMSAKYWRKPYGNLFNLTYINTGGLRTETGSSTALIYGGDTFISELTFGHINASGTLGVHLNTYMESTINSELRGTGTEVYETHIRRYNGWLESFLDLDGYPDDATKDFAQNYFNYDEHYSQSNNFRTYFPLSIRFDYCNSCPNSFPYRVWYSERAYQEELRDNYKNILANNYQDLLGSSGSITSLFVLQDQLYCLSEDAIWFIPTRPQQLTTNEGNIAVGNSDIFSLPPQRVETVERGYAGSMDPFSLNVTEFGAHWVDRNTRKIFTLFPGKGLTDMTMGGMRNWFYNNLNFEIAKQIPEFNNYSTLHKQGAGFVSTFDPRHNRWILSKKDYKIIDPALLLALVRTEDYLFGTAVGYNYTTGEFYQWTSGLTPTILNWQSDVTKIENKSWTVSYSFMLNAWDSFHTYRPSWMWHNQDRFFSTLESSATGFSHDSKSYRQYYNNTASDSMIDFIANDNPNLTKTLDSMTLYSKVEILDGNDRIHTVATPLSKIFVYTTKQSSGLITVALKADAGTPFADVFSTHGTAYVDYNEGRYNISGFYNQTSDETKAILTTDWASSTYRTERVTNGYLSYPNPTSYSLTKNLFTVGPVRDQWFGIQLYFTAATNNKVTTDFLATQQSISFK
jgi:hypothetical protein